MKKYGNINFGVVSTGEHESDYKDTSVFITTSEEDYDEPHKEFLSNPNYTLVESVRGFYGNILYIWVKSPSGECKVTKQVTKYGFWKVCDCCGACIGMIIWDREGRTPIYIIHNPTNAEKFALRKYSKKVFTVGEVVIALDCTMGADYVKVSHSFENKFKVYEDGTTGISKYTSMVINEQYAKKDEVVLPTYLEVSKNCNIRLNEV